MDESERIQQQVVAAANRLTEATRKLALLSRRKQFQRELRERGNWLANRPAEPPQWVKEWSEYWDGLVKDPAHIALVEEATAARAALHSDEFERAIESLRLGESGIAADWAISYLEADPWYFRSGYFKAGLSRWLRQVALSDVQTRRIQVALLKAITKGPREETHEFAKLARRVDDAWFRGELEKVGRDADRSTGIRANRLLANCHLNDYRQQR